MVTKNRIQALNWFKRVTDQRADLCLHTWPSRKTVTDMMNKGEIERSLGGALVISPLGRRLLAEATQ